jgi:ABC-2 type transport system permease protein
MLPLYFFQNQPQVSTKLVGVIDLSNENIARELQNELNRYYRLENRSPEYMILNVSVDNSPDYQRMKNEYETVESQLDSVDALHEEIKSQRSQYFLNRNTPNRETLLRTSYDRMQLVREEKELIQIELERYRSALDSLYERQARVMADSMLMHDVLNAYLVFPGSFTKMGQMEYHSKNPGDLLDTERLERILQTIIIKERVKEDGIERSQVRKWLRPVNIKKYQLFPQGQQEWNFYVQFYGPLIAVFLLFMAIFTAGGYLFSGVLLEKSNRVIEVLMSFATSRQIMGGKILGLGFLGLCQVLAWFAITSFLVLAEVLPAGQINYMNLTHALYFLLYFSLGFLFYGSLFIMIGSLFASEYDAQQINQILRTLAILPVLVSLLVFSEPNSDLIRGLSYIPFLTPSFMILRIPLSSTPITLDIWITTAIMVLSIVAVILISGKLFRLATLMQGKKPTWEEVLYWLKTE